MKRILFFLIIAAALCSVICFNDTALAQNESISFKLSRESSSKLTDNNISTYISFEKNEVIIVDTAGAEGMILKWYEPCAYSVILMDTGGKAERFGIDDTVLNKYIELGDIESVLIQLPNGGALCEIEFYYEETLPEDVQVWQEPYEKLDILLLSAHPDDEYLYFGGTLPYYGTQLGYSVNCVWLSHQKRLRQEEALSALWAMGVEHYPEFIGFPDLFSDTYERGARNWGEEETLKVIVEIFRKYKPEVVISHDPEGEYGHGAHMLTAAMAQKAATAAADETQFPESAQKYGVWQIKKLYLHLLKQNQIYMAWDEPMEAFGGKTGMEMAKTGYSFHESQHIFNLRVSADSRYACTKFGLAFTTVGEDINGNDFLENISEEDLTTYVPPEPEPESEPESEPEELQVVYETKEAADTEQPQNEQTKEPVLNEQAGITTDAAGQTGSNNILLIVLMFAGAAIVAAAGAVAAVLIIRRKKKA